MPTDATEFLDDDAIVPLDQQESEEDVHAKRSDVGSAVLFNTDWTVETLFRQIEKQNINLDPKFQRREAWDVNRKSKFIESILCSLPIPNVVLAEDKASKGRYVVIDGKQRLFAIYSFLRNEFELRNLSIRSDLNGRNFSSLSETSPDDVTALENYPIRSVIIRNWPDEDYLYTVFYRLNSGSLPLSPQELRKALHGGILLDYIDDFIQGSDAFKSVFGYKPDPRMLDIELVLRSVAFDRFYEDYRGDLKRFLDDTVKFYDGDWATQRFVLDEILDRLSQSLILTSLVFGKDAFKKWNGLTFERRINRAIFDVISRFFADRSLFADAKAAKEEVVQRFKKLCEESDAFRDAIERTTKTPGATRTRHMLWGEQLAKTLGRKLDPQAMRLI
jgi:Protein of unknown function DUF262